MSTPDHTSRCLLTDLFGWDEIDELVDDMTIVDPYEGDPPSKRKDNEINRVLSILDSLEERGNL